MKQLLKIVASILGAVILASVSLNAIAAGGERRVITLSPYMEVPPYPNASGRVTIWWEYGEEHPVWNDLDFTIDYSVKNLGCRDFGIGNIMNDGREGYTVYATFTTGETVRIQNFNTSCQTEHFNSFRVMNGFDAAQFRHDPICIDVVIMRDDGTDNNTWVMLRGTDGEGAVCREGALP